MVATQDSLKEEIKRMEVKIEDMSNQELKELLLLTNYKLSLTRSQVESLTEILIKNGITTYEEVWKKTNEIFKDMR